MSDREAAIRMAEEIRDERGPNRVMEIQRARMWDREPHEWTRYERHLSEALLGTEAELAAARGREAKLREALNATWEDVVVLLDDHVSAEIDGEARVRLIKRFAALADGEGEA